MQDPCYVVNCSRSLMTIMDSQKVVDNLSLLHSSHLNTRESVNIQRFNKGPLPDVKVYVDPLGGVHPV